jgi:hypothetical protein
MQPGWASRRRRPHADAASRVVFGSGVSVRERLCYTLRVFGSK